MKNLKKSLRAVNREMNALGKKVDRIIVAVDKLDKAAKKTKAQATKPKPAQKAAAKKRAAKKTAKPSAIDTVLDIIKRRKKGADTAALNKITGFKDHKLHNIVYKLKKQGKIKSKERGVYLKA